jgi:hypothetical protein
MRKLYYFKGVAHKTNLHMRLIILGLLAALAVNTTLVSCGGKGGSSAEAALTVTTNPTTVGNDVQAPAPGPDFPLTVQITSVMPPKGVTIVVTAAEDGTANSTFFTQTLNTTSISNSFSITKTPALVNCIVNITVTSNTKSTNVWSGSYLYTMK